MAETRRVFGVTEWLTRADSTEAKANNAAWAMRPIMRSRFSIKWNRYDSHCAVVVLCSIRFSLIV